MRYKFEFELINRMIKFKYDKIMRTIIMITVSSQSINWL